MSEDRSQVSRRGLLATAGSLSIAGALGAPVSSSASAFSMASAPAETAEKTAEITARAAVDALEGAYRVNPGLRRNHTKGVGALGTFVGSPEMAEFSRSLLFSGREMDVVARFSIAGGDPEASDLEKSPRGIGLEFRLPNGGLQHMTMLHTPMFFAHVPQTFVDKFVALKLDPATGKPDPVRFKAFGASHSDIASQVKFLDDNNPPPSYANCAYYSIHTFKFINQYDKVTLVRWRFVPLDGEKKLSDEELKSMSSNFLEQALIERTQLGPVLWDMIVTIGEPGDPETDPTVLWPKDRKEVRAGTLTLSSAAPDKQAGSYGINYDPLVLSDGIEATDDPVLRFRSSSYALSFTRRLQNV